MKLSFFVDKHSCPLVSPPTFPVRAHLVLHKNNTFFSLITLRQINSLPEKAVAATIKTIIISMRTCKYHNIRNKSVSGIDNTYLHEKKKKRTKNPIGLSKGNTEAWHIISTALLSSIAKIGTQSTIKSNRKTLQESSRHIRQTPSKEKIVVDRRTKCCMRT
jgi:hypothetical protein